MLDLARRATNAVVRNEIMTQQIRERVLEALRAGKTLRDAAACAGIAAGTLNIWRRRGRDGHPEYVDFALAIDKAEADFRTFLQEQITEASVKDWNAAAWMLARRDWQNYDPRAMLAHRAAEAQRAVDLTGLSSEDVQSKFLDSLKAAVQKDAGFRRRVKRLLESADEVADDDACLDLDAAD